MKEKHVHPQELIDAYRRGENIASLLKRMSGAASNSEDIVETAYDLQTGSYVAALTDQAIYTHKLAYGTAIANEILSLTAPASILEAGIGEGTTLSFVLVGLGGRPLQAHGFDISWSRVACCRDWLGARGHESAFLSVASLLHLPYGDDSFDVVYTSHAIEPNGGNEARILKELHRVAAGFLVLLEPGYELASAEAKRRMEAHGYCRGMIRHAEDLGMRVVKHQLFPFTANPLNPTAIIVIEKAAAGRASPTLACPRHGRHVARLRRRPLFQGQPSLPIRKYSEFRA